MAAADVDSIEQLKKRVCRVAFDGQLEPDQIEISKPSMTTALELDKSLMQLVGSATSHSSFSLFCLKLPINLVDTG
jgi:hypothetical protein